MPSSTFAPGHHLVSRYRIEELLGVGQTAEVYLAADLSLQRPVVVKVLLPRLAEHEDVRRAFRDRIVRAATLSHPHLARVFDGGQESGAIFMICEHLDGGSLDDVLGSGRTLDVDDGARLGRDVASALGYVHANGFVHGSLSPSKLLFDDEGRVRVSDIALAGLGDAFRERFTLDDVRYLSPEQAIGDPADAKSDVYALALILFEAVTGTTAFDGTTPEMMLRSRINASLPIRSELGTLDMLLAQAAVADPRLRLDAEQFSSRLSAVIGDTSPLVVAPVRREVPLLAQFTPPEPRNSIGFRAPSPDQIVGAAAVTGQFPQSPGVRPSDRWVPSGSREVPETVRRVAPRGLERVEFERPARTRRLAFLVAALVLIVVAAGGAVVWKLGLFTQKHSVPSLITLTLPQAAAAVQSDGFTVTANNHVHSSLPKGEIVSQTPAPPAVAKSGLVILVTLSDGRVMVTVPLGLVGEDCATATSQLVKLKITAQCPSSAAVASATTAAGRVVRVLYQGKPAPASVPAGSVLVLALSLGQPGATTTTTTTTTPGATTTSTTTSTTTTIVQPSFAMPNVVGMIRAQVDATMRSVGLYYSTRGPGAGTTKWTSVVSSVPAAGTLVKKFSTVTLNVK